MRSPCFGRARERNRPFGHVTLCTRALRARAPLLLGTIAAWALVAVDTHAQVLAQPDLSPTAAAQTIEAPPLVPPQASSTQLVQKTTIGSVNLRDIEDPELPGLVRKSDGSYRFQGRNISAVISKDGQVTFRDSYLGFTRKMTPMAPPPRDLEATPNGANYQRSTPWLALQLRIDLYGYIESRLGNDPYLSERRWFMERTRDLRESLSERSLIQSLRSTLLKIWSDAGLSLATRKRETFELWNQTNNDDDGRTAREMVLTFVRERCPAHSSCEFRAADLKRFNDMRRPQEAFAPYGVAREQAATTRSVPAANQANPARESSPRSKPVAQ